MHIPPDLGQPWQGYAANYRADEMQTLASWILAGASGSVIGLSGIGKTNLLNFLSHRPDVLQAYLSPTAGPVIVVPVDLNNLPVVTLSAFYRVILRAFYEIRGRFEADIQAIIVQQYAENRAATDPFLPLSALRELLLTFQVQNVQIIFVLDRFDLFSKTATPEMGDTLRGLRDSFQDTVSYIVGLRHDPIYHEEMAAFGEMSRLVTAHICCVGLLQEEDARALIARRMRGVDRVPSEAEIHQMLALAGGYPTLLKAVCRWWVLADDCPSKEAWLTTLLADVGIRIRLHDIWLGLTQEEQKVLVDLTRIHTIGHQERLTWHERHGPVLQMLENKGVCMQQGRRWCLFGSLFEEYVKEVGSLSRGKIWADEEAQLFYQDTDLIDNLTPKEELLLHFLITRPKERHTYTALIDNVWGKDERNNGVSNESLHQIVRGLRQKIEPNPSQSIYLVNWRGKPEGGYQFFAEGKPQ